MTTDKQVKDAIAQIWSDTSTALGESVRVIPRWKLSLKGREVMSALRSTFSDKLINGVYITRVKSTRRKLGSHHWEYKWTYAMFYFRSYDEGTDTNNSEDKLNVFLEAVGDAIAAVPGLALVDVDDHEEMQIENIDTIDLRVHSAQCFLTVNLTKQG
jgi:hypothetical protein